MAQQTGWNKKRARSEFVKRYLNNLKDDKWGNKTKITSKEIQDCFDDKKFEGVE